MAIKWTQEMYDELKLAESPQDREDFANKYGLSFANVDRRRRKLVGTQGEPINTTDSVLKFLSKGRTVDELQAKGYTLKDLEVDGYDLFETRNNRYELTYLLLPKVDVELDILPKNWTYRWAVDPENGKRQPYLMIQLPDTNWDKVKVVPLADVHFGAEACLITKFREYVNWMEKHPNVYGFLSGDLFENSHGDSNKGLSHYEQSIRPKDQITQMAEILAPIAGRILWGIPGNHEDRSRTRDFDPMERLCEILHIPYSYEPVFVDVLWKGNVYSFHDQHGTAGGQTKGGKMNAAVKPQKMQEFVMFTIMAHVHDGDVSRNTRICRNRVEFYLEFKKQYIIICPSFYGYFGSYASKAGYEPGSYGAINIDLFPNGDYHANS